MSNSEVILPDRLHELRENEAVVDLLVHTREAWENCRDGVMLECPVCKKHERTRVGGKPVALDTRAARSTDAVRGMNARVWQGLECLVCHADVTVVLVYDPHGARPN